MSTEGHSARDVHGGNLFQIGNVHGSISSGEGGGQHIPRQLGRPFPLFTDRWSTSERMEAYRVACRKRGELPVLVLQGVRGVGKTELARWYLNQVAEEYAGPHLQISLDSSAVELSPEVLLDRVLSDLGVDPAVVPDDREGKRAALRTRTAQRAAIILLDGVTEATQVSELIPNSANAIVVATSAQRLPQLALEAAEFLTVEPMDDEAVTEFLGRALPEERRAELDRRTVDRLLAFCQGLPNRAESVARRLVGNPFESVEELLDDLEQSGEESSTEAGIDTAVRALGERAGRLYRLAGLHFGPGIDKGALAAVFDRDDLNGTLKQLWEHSLAEPLRSGHRIRLTPAVLRDASERAVADLGREEAFGVKARQAAYYREAVLRASSLISRRWMVAASDGSELPLPRMRDSVQARAWMRDNLDTLLAVVRWCHDAREYETVWQVAEAVDGYLRENGRYTERQEFLRLGTRAAVALGHTAAEARMRNQHGLTFLDLRRVDDAHAEFTRALELARGDNDTRGQGAALEALGLAAQRRGGHSEALVQFDQARPHKEVTGKTHDVAVLDLLAARSLIALGEPAAALERLSPALTVFRSVGEHDKPDPLNTAKTLLERGRALAGQGIPDQARSALEEALTLFTDTGNTFQQARVHEALAEVVGEGTVERRAQLLSRAVELYRAIGNDPEADRVAESLEE